MDEGQNGGNGAVAGGVTGAVSAVGVASGTAGNRVNFDAQNLQGGGNSRNPQGFPQGDVIFSGGEPEKKSRKGLIILIVLVVLLVVAGGGFLLWRSGAFGNNAEQQVNPENAEFHEVVEASADDVYSLLRFVYGVYDEQGTLESFMLEQDDYGKATKMLEGGLAGLKAINERLQNGEELEGTVAQINLEENYQKLKEVLAVDLPKYEKIVEFSEKVLEVMQASGKISAAETLKNYNVTSLAKTIDDYFAEWQSIKDAYVNNNCGESQTEACNALESRVETLRGALSDTKIITAAYKNVVGDLVYWGEGSAMYYLNNLYVGTEISNGQ